MAKDKKHLEQRKKLREDKTDAQNKVIASRIRDLMQEADITSKELAVACYRDESDISRWLNKEGINKIPVWELSLISAYLDENTEQGCSIEYLIGKSDARHYEYDSVVKKLGLSDGAIDYLTHENNSRFRALNELNAINDLLENGKSFIRAVNNFKLAPKPEYKRNKTRYYDELIERGMNIYYFAAETASTMNISVRDAFFLQCDKREINISKEDMENLYIYCMREESLERRKQACIVELSKYLDSIK